MEPPLGTSMFSPRQPSKRDKRLDDHLPQGDCRYILLHPESKGLRCACVGFSLNAATPGSSCHCGHQACYHTPEKEGPSVERQELEALRRTVARLEERLEDERSGGASEVIQRLGSLEESLEKHQAETATEVKNLYRGIGGVWHNVGVLQKRTPYYDDHIEGLVDDVQRIRQRLIEIDDASISLEDRVDNLETTIARRPTSPSSRRRKASTPPSSIPNTPTLKTEFPFSGLGSGTEARSPIHQLTTDEIPTLQSFRDRVASVGSDSQSWTVHISLLPSPSQPFPFEKDTAAYKRCLSRGMHRVVAIPDTDAASFITTVSSAFREILQDRPWQPLVARICDAKNLRGLPMLRQLQSWLLNEEYYTYAFLQRNCAVTEIETGKILDLYIAMNNDCITWPEMQAVSPFIKGLEASWSHDPYLDGKENDLEMRAAAGDIVPTWSSPSLKRKECDISRETSTPSAVDDTEAPRAKILVRRRAEAV